MFILPTRRRELLLARPHWITEGVSELSGSWWSPELGTVCPLIKRFLSCLMREADEAH